MLHNVTCPTCQHRYYLEEAQMLSRQICPKCQSVFFAGKSAAEGKAAASPILASAAAAASTPQSYAKTMVGESLPPIKYACPRCKAPLEAEAIEAGTKKNCPNCTQRHQVPAAPKPEPAAVKPALDKTMLASDESAAPPPPIKYNCPGCKKPLEAPADQAGTKRNCPACNQRLQVPAAPAGKPNINKTMLASDESAGPATAAHGAATGAHGTVPIPAGAPANPWAQAMTPKNIAIGVLVLLLLLLIVPPLIRGGKADDTEAVAKAKIELEKLRLELDAKQKDMDRQAKEAADARKKYDDDERERRRREDQIQADNRRALAQADDDSRAALKKKQQLEQDQRDKEAREREARFQQMLDESQRKLDQTKKDLEAVKSKETHTQTIITQPPPVYYPPYNPYYWRPWGW
jgi:DNA-directed RNA polymerase subunit RPC12/RpoP